MHNSISILIVFLLVITAVHFIYWSIIVPNTRLKFRHSGFIIRDKIHKYKLEASTKQDLLLLENLEKSIKNIMNRMQDVTFLNLFKAYKDVQKNEKTKEGLARFEKKIKESNNQAIKEIDKEITMLFGKIFVLNFGMHLLFLIPFILVLKLIKSFYNRIDKTIEILGRFFEITPNHKYNLM